MSSSPSEAVRVTKLACPNCEEPVEGAAPGHWVEGKPGIWKCGMCVEEFRL